MTDKQVRKRLKDPKINEKPVIVISATESKPAADKPVVTSPTKAAVATAYAAYVDAVVYGLVASPTRASKSQVTNLYGDRNAAGSGKTFATIVSSQLPPTYVGFDNKRKERRKARGYKANQPKPTTKRR